MTLGRKRKSFQSKSLVRLKDMTAYMVGKTLTLLGLERPKLDETEMVENHVSPGSWFTEHSSTFKMMVSLQTFAFSY